MKHVFGQEQSNFLFFKILKGGQEVKLVNLLKLLFNKLLKKKVEQFLISFLKY